MKLTGKKIVSATVGLLAASLVWHQVDAYTVAAGSAEPCHELFTARAYREVAPELSTDHIVFPKDDTWLKLSNHLLKVAGIDPESVPKANRFLLLSLVVGTRVNDTDGHTLFNLASLRKVHADPSAEGQYTHALRGPDDDYDEGNVIAVEGTRMAIVDLLHQVLDILERPHEGQIVKTTVYLDFYGEIDVHVWGPAFYMGSAAHIIEDSFAHCIRTEQSGFRRIAHVMNYIDAISSDHDELRDGLAHSDRYDECENSKLQPIVQAVDEATAAFFRAVDQALTTGSDTAIIDYLDEWFTLEEGCTIENDLCDNAFWLKLAREKQTKPYLEAICGCSTIGRKATGGSYLIAVLLLLGIFVSVRRLRTQRRQ